MSLEILGGSEPPVPFQPVPEGHFEVLARMLDVARSMTGELDLERLLDRILAAAVAATGAEQGYLRLVEPPPGPRVSPERFHRLDAAQMESQAFAPSRSVIDRVLREGRGVLVADALGSPEASESVRRGRLRSILCEPLVRGGQVLGVLYLHSSQFTGLFTEQHLRILQALAAQASVCLENARLFAAVEEATRQKLEHEARWREMEARREATLAFVSIAAHDLKGPLNSLMTGLWLLPQVDAREARDQVMEALHSCLHRSLRLVSTYMDYARVEDGEPIVPVLAEVDVRALVEEEVRRLAERLGGEGLELQEVRRDDLPAGLRLQADRDLLSQILANLLDNAARYSRGRGEIRVSGRREGDRTTLEVADQGPGLPAADLPRLFERFQRIPATSSGTRGTGLGLWITRRMVEVHGWSIEVDSTEGVGTTFRIVAPG